MKKSKILPLLTLSCLFVLGACNGEAEGSSPFSSTAVDGGQDYVAENSVSGLIATLFELKSSFNFTFHNNYGNDTYFYDKGFYCKDGDEQAYVLLPSHQDVGKKIAYIVRYLDNGDPYLYAMGYYSDAYGNRYEMDENYFQCFSLLSNNLSESAFVLKDGAYLTEDSGVLSSFNSLYGTTIDTISFWFSDANSVLNFELFSSSGDSLSTGYFSHIGNTKKEKLSSFINSFSWQSNAQALKKEQASTLFDENFSAKTNIYKIANYTRKLIATTDFSCDANTMYLHSVDNPEDNPSDYYTYVTERESDGRAIYHGLSAQNEAYEEESNFFFSQWPLPKELNINDFRYCGDGKYRYFSLDPNLVYQTLTHTTINDSACSFEEAYLDFNGNQVSGVTMYAEYNGARRYKATATLEPYQEISMPTPYVDEGLKEVKNAVSYFDGETPFKVVRSNRPAGETPTRKTTYTFDGYTYLVEEETLNSTTNTFEKAVSGYATRKDGAIVPFRKIKGKDKLVQSEEIVADDKMVNHFPLTFDPKSVKKTADGSYRFKELITGVFNTTWISNNAIPSTVSMKMEGGKLTSIQYGVNYSVDDGEYLSFDYDNTALSEPIDATKIGPMELTCYEDDSPDEWQDLVHYIGSEYANAIPYYYDKNNVGNWYAEPRYASGTSIPDVNEEGEIDFDSPLIGIGLYCASSKVPTSVLDEGFTANGFTKVTNGEKLDVGYRDDDYEANGYDSPIRLVDPNKQSVWMKEGNGGAKLRVIYDNDIAYYHFNPSYAGQITLGSGLFIQPLDKDGNVVIHR